MVLMRCKCGANEFYGSGIEPAPCMPCHKCHTVPGTGPNNHPDPVPHEFVEHIVETDAGDSILSRCKYCNKTKNQIKKSGVKDA